MVAKYDFSTTRAAETLYWGKVVSSKVGRPSDEYLAKMDERRRRTAPDQWQIEIEPLYPFVYENHGTLTRSVNLPVPGTAPSKESGIVMMLSAYKACGFDIQNENDFENIVGHIFYFKREERKEGRTTMTSDWPQVLIDGFVAPAEPTMIASRDSDSGSNGSSPGGGDPWKVAADVLDGQAVTPGAEIRLVIGSGNPLLNGNQEILTLVQKNGLAGALVEKKLGTLDEKSKVFSKA